MKPKAVTVWACSLCNEAHLSSKPAEECCTCTSCKKPFDRPQRGRCDACRFAAEIEREQKAVERAAVIPWSEYEHEWLYSMTSNRYFSVLEEVDDYYDQENIARPERLWACSPIAFEMDAESLIEMALSGHAEGAGDRISDEDRKELQDFLDAWCERQCIVSYEYDESTMVALPLRDEPEEVSEEAEGEEGPDEKGSQVYF